MSGRTFVLEVEGEGDFEFHHRNMRLEFAIEAQYSRLVGGQAQPTPALDNYARIFATLDALIVKAPDKFVLWDLDPLEDEGFKRAAAVFKKLREKEVFFRSGGGKGREGDGKKDGQEPGVPVP